MAPSNPLTRACWQRQLASPAALGEQRWPKVFVSVAAQGGRMEAPFTWHPPPLDVIGARHACWTDAEARSAGRTIHLQLCQRRSKERGVVRCRLAVRQMRRVLQTDPRLPSPP